MSVITTAGSGNWSSTTPNAPWAGGSVPTSADDVTIGRTSTFTVTIASPAIISKTAHGLTAGADLYPTTSGALPTGLSINTKYYVISAGLTANAFEVSQTLGGSAVNTSGTQSGTHTYFADTVTLDTTGLVANSLINNGTLISSTTASSALTTQLGIAQNSMMTQDMSTAAAYTSTVLMNASNNATSQGLSHAAAASFTHKGAPKTSWTTIVGAMSAGATSCTVANATGWRTGDTLIFATTGAYNATPLTDTVTNITVSGTSISWTGGTTNAHANGCPVANMTRNAVVGTSNSAYKSFVNAASQTGTSIRVIHDVLFQNMASGYTSFPSLALRLAGNQTALAGVYNCAFLNNNVDSGVYQTSPGMDWQANATYSTGNGFSSTQAFTDWRASANLILRGATAMSSSNPNDAPAGNYISGCTNALFAPANGQTWKSCEIWSCSIAVGGGSTIMTLASLTTSNLGIIAPCSTIFNAAGGPFVITATDCNFQASNLFATSALDITKLTLVNKNADPGVQEIYTRHSSTVPVIQRNTGTVNRSTSSIQMTLNYSGAVTKTFDVLAKAGETITLLTYVRKSSSPAYGASTLPSVTVSGLGITPVVSTMSGGTAADTWELLTTTATNSSSSDGNLTVTLTTQSATAGAQAFFSGLPTAPYITRCRHYGYLFNESSPTRSADALASANEATAAAYTGMAITWGATSSISMTGDTTFQHLFDYHQSQACLNVSSGLALTGAGVAGAPSLFAAGNVTTTGYTLNGGGSLSMGSYTLTASTYTFTGGTFAQATSVPAFSGGTLSLATAGTYSYGFSGGLHISCAGSGGYHLDAGTWDASTITIDNPNNVAITVYVPVGVTAVAGTNSGNTTISAPTVNQSVTVSGFTAGSRIQIYDTTHSVELFNGTASAGNTVVSGSTATWTDPTAASGSRAIRVRVAYVAGVAADNFVDASVGTCGTTSGNAAVSYLVSPASDAVYDANAIDGSAVAGITITVGPSRVNINIGGGSVTWPGIYAYQVYWQFTATGIAQETAFILAKDTANYVVTTFQIKNTSATPLTITSGFGVDSVTGGIAAIIDTAGSAGNIYPQPEHVVAYATGSSLTGPQAAQLAAIPTNPLLTTDTRLNHLDSDVSSRASAAGLAAIPTNTVLASDSRLNNLDAAISSRSTFSGGAVASVTAAVTVGTNSDKSGYALSSPYDAAKTAATQASVSAIPSATADAVWAKTLP